MVTLPGNPLRNATITLQMHRVARLVHLFPFTTAKFFSEAHVEVVYDAGHKPEADR
jgi:hypothetical protein